MRLCSQPDVSIHLGVDIIKYNVTHIGRIGIVICTRVLVLVLVEAILPVLIMSTCDIHAKIDVRMKLQRSLACASRSPRNFKVKRSVCPSHDTKQMSISMFVSSTEGHEVGFRGRGSIIHAYMYMRYIYIYISYM